MNDRAAIEELYRKHASIVLRRARALLRDDQAARDAVQEVFVRALKAGAAFRGDASPITWLYRATTNYCLNEIRNRTRRGALLTRAHHPDAPPDQGHAEDRHAVLRLLAAVGEELQEIAVYYYVDQMKQEEIASLLGVSRRTIGNRLEAFRSAAERMLDGTLQEAQ